jgi:hypothetical protein
VQCKGKQDREQKWAWKKVLVKEGEPVTKVVNGKNYHLASEKESTCILPFVHPNEHVIACSSFMWLEIHVSTEEFTLFLYVRMPLVIASHNLFPRGQKDALTSHLILAN